MNYTNSAIQPMTFNLRMRLSVLMFLQYFLWGAWFVTAGTYLLNALEFSGREVGLVYGSVAIAATVSPFFVGFIADRMFPVEKLLGVLHLLGSALLITLPALDTFWTFYLGVTCYLFLYLPTFSLASSLCFHHIEHPRLQFPSVRVWGTIGWIVAGIIVGWWALEATYYPFYIAGATSVLQGVYCLTLPHTPPAKDRSQSLLNALSDVEVRGLVKDKSFLVLIISVAFICIPSSYYYSFVNPFLVDMDIVNSAGKMAIGQVTEIVLMLILPWLFRSLGLKWVMFIGLFIWGSRYGLFMIGIGNHEIWFFIALLLHGVAYTMSTFAAQIYLDEKVPIHLRSTAQGFYSLLTMGVMAFVGTYIAGETVAQYTLADGSRDWYNIWLIPTVVGTVVSIFFLVAYQPNKN